MNQTVSPCLVFSLSFLLSMLSILDLSAQVWYVRTGGEGMGTSWEEAFGSLQQALDQAEAGDQIWVAEGTYLPCKGEGRKKSFVIDRPVELFGGFEGWELTLSERVWKQHNTVLSGEIGETQREDNAFHVLRIAAGGSGTLIDGFTIRGGMADGESDTPEALNSGGGIRIEIAEQNGSARIRNCIFLENYGVFGGALYLSGKKGSCRTTIENCHFKSNYAFQNGGAIYNDGENGNCQSEIENCLFTSNQGFYGGAIYNNGEFGKASPIISQCVFTNNISLVRGSAIYSHSGRQGESMPQLMANDFQNNLSKIGGPVGSTVN